MSKFEVTGGSVDVPLEERLEDLRAVMEGYVETRFTEHEADRHGEEPEPPPPEEEPPPPPEEEEPPPDPPPPSDRPMALEKVREIEHRGITWRFTREEPVGYFANGDPCVIGDAVSLESYPTASAINPRTGLRQGFHKEFLGWDPALRVSENPRRLRPGESLVSLTHRQGAPVGSVGLPRPAVDRCEVLTCLGEPPPADTLRPPFMGDKKPLWRRSDFRWSKIPSLAAVSGMPTAASLAERVAHPFLDCRPTWEGRYLHPAKNTRDYGRDFCADTELAIWGALSDIPGWEDLLLHCVQHGIDMYATFTETLSDYDNFAPWGTIGGGHGQGRLWPILFAGYVLGNEAMLGVATGKPGTAWQEHCQTQILTGPMRTAHPRFRLLGTGDPVWIDRWCMGRAMTDAQYGYRLCCTGNSWLLSDLACRALGLTNEFGHDPFFAYNQHYQAEVRRENRPTWMWAWHDVSRRVWDRYNLEYVK